MWILVGFPPGTLSKAHQGISSQHPHGTFEVPSAVPLRISFSFGFFRISFGFFFFKKFFCSTSRNSFRSLYGWPFVVTTGIFSKDFGKLFPNFIRKHFGVSSNFLSGDPLRISTYDPFEIPLRASREISPSASSEMLSGDPIGTTSNTPGKTFRCFFLGIVPTNVPIILWEFYTVILGKFLLEFHFSCDNH